MTKYIKTVTLTILLLLTATPASAQSAGIEWETLNAEVGKLYQEGKYDRAVVVARKAIEVAEKNAGKNHPSVARSLNDLAELYRTQGQYALAESLHKRALAIWEKALSPNHLDVATSLNNLALLYKTQGQYALALPFYKRALAIWGEALGPSHPNVAACLENLAILYRAINKQKRWSSGQPASVPLSDVLCGYQCVAFNCYSAMFSSDG